MKISTWILIAGLLFLLLPIPPVGLVGGTLLLVIGILLKLFTEI